MKCLMKILFKSIFILTISLPFFSCSTHQVHLADNSDPNREYSDLSAAEKESILGSSSESDEESAYPICGMSTIMNKIDYPRKARIYGIEGIVLMQAVIDENGNVIETKLIKGLGYGLDEIVENAIKNTKFKPAIKNGSPVPDELLFPFRFKLAQ